MAYERVVTVGRHKYRQLVESYWDPKARQTRKRILQHLGPVAPRFPRADPALLPRSLPIEPVHFGLLATRMMAGSLTPHQVVQAVHEMGEEIPPGTLSAVGIRFDLGEKTLELLLWLEPPSPRPGPVPSATPPGRSKAATRPASSRSKDPAR
jgi:hypothetical protein